MNFKNMIKNISLKKKLSSDWFKNLQDIICNEFQKLENEFARKNKQKPKLFKKKSWRKLKNNGGGTYALIRNGALFDSVGVNFSNVSGKFQKKFRNQILGASKKPNYWASGISVVAHMKNPNIPAMHFNTRFIITSENWFGGGIDCTPSIKDTEERRFFHKEIKFICDKYNKNYYPKYKKWCDDYFYLPHRKETRGIGGIFFDYKRGNWEEDFSFVKDVGLCFLKCTKAIIKKKMLLKWTKKQKNTQFIKRGRYVEFNLLYDKGTKFGLSTGGNVEAILMSLPPEVKWK